LTTDVSINDMETRELATAVWNLRQQRRVISRDIWTYEAELRRRMASMDVEALPNDAYDIRLEKGGSPSYDADILRAKLGELLTPDEMARLIEEIPASYKVSGRFARTLSAKYKGKVADAIADARSDPEPRLSIKRR
jgi:predicted lipase